MRAGILRQAALLSLGALLLLGPAQGDPSDDLAGTPGATGAGLEDKSSDFNNIEIVDSSLGSKIDLVRIGSKRGENNLLTVFAGIQNKTDRRLDLEVETIYKDKSGNELNTGSWIHIALKPHEDQDYRSSAISEGAVDFLIRVRRAPTSTAAAH